MNQEKIAVLVDTCCDVPAAFVEQYHMYVIPLKVIYKDAEYLDGVDITPEEVYQGLEREVPKTSLPSGERIAEIFDQIRADGFKKVIAITLFRQHVILKKVCPLRKSRRNWYRALINARYSLW